MSEAAVAWFIVKVFAAAAISYALRPEGPEIEGPRLDSLVVQRSAFGAPIRKVWGSARLAGNIIWSDGLQEHKTVESTGGKGSKGGGTRTTYHYTCTFAVGICKGEIDGIKRIWADSKLIYNRSETTLSPWKDSLRYQQSVASSASIAIYAGTETQDPDPIIESAEGTGNVPGYRGLAYIVFEDMDLSNFGNRIPNLEFEVATGSKEEDVWITNEDIDGHIATSSSTTGQIKSMLYYFNEYLYIETSNVIRMYKESDGGLIDEINTPAMFLAADATGISGYSYSVAYWKDGDDCRSKQLMSGNEEIFGKAFSELSGSSTYGWVGGVGYSDYYGRKIALIQSVYDHTINVFPFPEFLENADLITGGIKPLDVYSCNYVFGQVVIYGGQIISVSSYDMDIRVTDFETLPDYKEKWNARVLGTYVGGLTVNNNGDLLLVTGGLSSAYGASYDQGIIMFEGISNTVKTVTTFSDGAGSPAQIDSIISEILENAGLSASQYDVSELSGDTVIGYIQTDVMEAEELLKPLMRAYQFDVAEQDWQVVCRKRGSSAATNIPWDDLAAREAGSEAPESLIEAITDETEMPLELELEYRDYDTNYQPAVERAKRSTSTVNTDNKKKLQYPIIMQSTQALRAVETLFEATWVQRKSYSLQVPTDYIKLTPGDVFTVADTYKLIAGEVTVSFPLIVKLKAFAEDSASYTSSSTGVAPYVAPQTLTTTAPVFPVFIDIPALEGYATEPAFYLAVFALEEGWKLSVVFRSLDDGQTWAQIAAVENMSIVGRTTDALANGPVTVVDEGNTVNVDLKSYNSDLSGASLLSVFAGTNTAAIGADDRWEIVSFSEVTEEADGTFTLSNLVRGRRGTDHNTGNHQADDTFALLESDKLVRIPIPETSLDATIKYKIVPVGKSLQAAASVEFICEGDILRPYSPVHITGSRNASDDLTIKWIRRCRGDFGWNQSGVPLLEETEKYEIDIYDGSSVVRTITVTGATSTTYTAADQTTDFGSAQSSITLKIYQISATVGRGYGREATL